MTITAKQLEKAGATCKEKICFNNLFGAAVDITPETVERMIDSNTPTIISLIVDYIICPTTVQYDKLIDFFWYIGYTDETGVERCMFEFHAPRALALLDIVAGMEGQ